MASAKIGINGFGRIGRLVARFAQNNPDLEIVGINDVVDLNVLAYLFKYDSAYGPFDGTVEVDGNNLVVNGKAIRYTSILSPAELPWGELGVDYAVESTGIFRDTANPAKDPRMHLTAGAKRVVVSAPAKTEADVKMLVLGVNHTEFDPALHTVLSNASCTTNCLAPVVKVIHDNWGVESGLMTTIHAATAGQATVDSPSKKFDPLGVRSGRSVFNNIIPAATGAAAAIGLVMPAVRGKLTGMAMRVPTMTGSAVDLTVVTERDTSLNEIGAKMKAAAETPLGQGGMKGILAYSEDALVSSDIIGDTHSSIFDRNACIEFKENRRFFKVVSWYDNEAGYANRLVDLLTYMAGREG